MLKWALCDDEEEQRSALTALLRGYLERPDAPPVKLAVFSSGHELLSAAEDFGSFDLYLLDVVMPELSGIDLGKQLRSLGGGVIIYLSVSPDFALDSYHTQAFYYLLKPPQPDQLYGILDRAVDRMKKEHTAHVTVKTRDGMRLIRLDDIQYVELVRRSAHYHLSRGELVAGLTLRTSFRESVAPLLSDPRFFLCGSSFVVNLYYVTAIERGSFLLDGGTRVPLTRSQTTQAQQRWRSYWLDETRGADIWKF